MSWATTIPGGMGMLGDVYSLDVELKNIAVAVDHGRISQAEVMLTNAESYFTGEADRIQDSYQRIQAKLDVARKIREMRAYIDSRRAGAEARLREEESLEDDYAQKNREVQADPDEARRLAIAQKCPWLYESPFPLSVQEAMCNATPGNFKLSCESLPGPFNWVCENPGKSAGIAAGLVGLWVFGPAILGKVVQTTRAVR